MNISKFTQKSVQAVQDLEKVAYEYGNQEVEQKLHYVGIPLRANWNFLDKKLVTLYVSGGGMVEKCVYGKLGSEKETVKPLQFSVSGAVGAQVNATKRLGIYVEPVLLIILMMVRIYRPYVKRIRLISIYRLVSA